MYFRACYDEFTKVVEFHPGHSTIVKRGTQHIFVCEEGEELRDAAEYTISNIPIDEGRGLVHYHALGEKIAKGNYFRLSLD